MKKNNLQLWQNQSAFQDIIQIILAVQVQNFWFVWVFRAVLHQFQYEKISFSKNKPDLNEISKFINYLL